MKVLKTERAKLYLRLRKNLRKIEEAQNQLMLKKFAIDRKLNALKIRCKKCGSSGRVHGEDDFGCYTAWTCTECEGEGAWYPDDILAAQEVEE